MASAVIGALRVTLGADTAAFSDGLTKAQLRLKRFSAGMASAAKIGAAAMAAALTGASVALKSTINDMDAMSKASQSLGVPVEQLAKLRYAADLSGASFETLSTGIRKFSQSIGDALSGMASEAVQAFDALGISLTRADGTLKSTTTLLGEVANKLAGISDGARKTDAAMALFGRSGAALIPLLNQGADGLAAMGVEAENLGLVFSGRAGRAAEAFNDNLTRMGKIFKGIFYQLAERLLPAMHNISDAMFDLSKQSETIATITDGLAFAFKTLASIVVAAAATIQEITMALGMFARAAGHVIKLEFSKAGEAVSSGIRDLKQYHGEMNGIIQKIWSSGPSRDDINRANEFADAVKSTIRNSLPGSGLGDAGGKLAGASRSIRSARQQTVALKGDIEEAEGAFGSFGDAIASTFGNAITGLIDGTKKFKDVLRDLANQMISTFANNAFKGIFGTLFGGGGGGTSLLGNLFQGFAGGFASGGRIPSGKWGVVGERGPEPVIGPASVVSNRDFMASGRGGGTVINANFSVNGTVGLKEINQVVRAGMSEVARSIPGASVGAVSVANRRSPGLI